MKAFSSFLVVSVFCAAPCFSKAADKWVTYEGQDGPGKGKTIVLISGDEEYRSEEALPMLGKLLSVRHGFTCHVLFSQDENGEINPNNSTNIPGMQLLKDADLVIMSLRFRELPDEDMKYFDDYLKAGKPFIALRTSTHAFNYTRDKDSPYAKYSFNANGEWKGGFGRHVLGETWVNHHGGHGRESTGGIIRDEHAGHPVLKGVKDVWGPTDVYGVVHLPDDVKILMDGAVLTGMKQGDPPKADKPTMPLVWVREFPSPGGHNRILCTTMGASVDLENEGLRRLIVNGAYWATGLEDKITGDANVDPVGEYKPTFFGFNKFTKGVKVSDHKL